MNTLFLTKCGKEINGFVKINNAVIRIVSAQCLQDIYLYIKREGFDNYVWTDIQATHVLKEIKNDVCRV